MHQARNLLVIRPYRLINRHYTELAAMMFDIQALINIVNNNDHILCYHIENM